MTIRPWQMMTKMNRLEHKIISNDWVKACLKEDEFDMANRAAFLIVLTSITEDVLVVLKQRSGMQVDMSLGVSELLANIRCDLFTEFHRHYIQTGVTYYKMFMTAISQVYPNEEDRAFIDTGYIIQMGIDTRYVCKAMYTNMPILFKADKVFAKTGPSRLML